MSDRRIFVDYIARTEGDGAIDIIIGPNGEPVSYTHLDVYKRQVKP